MTDYVSPEVPPSGGVGVVLANLGTPDAPTPGAVRRYLKEFLADPRVVELPRLLWLPILYLFVLTFRPFRSARAYQTVWTPEGSPLLLNAQAQAEGVRQSLARRLGREVPVELGMAYGNPSLPSALANLRRSGVSRVVVLPLYPQYSGSTTGSVLDRLFAELSRWRAVPAVRTVDHYSDDPGYIAALVASLRERENPAEHLVFSFHGVPERYVTAGDPYRAQCVATAHAVVQALELPDGAWTVAFQSRFGPDQWLEPSTEDTLKELGARGVKSVDVLCPGFSSDCLETLEEIAVEGAETFHEAGGERLHLVPCLNDRPDHVEALAEIVERNLLGWVD